MHPDRFDRWDPNATFLPYRSERVQGKEPTNYNERVLAGLGLNEDIGERGGKGLRLLRGEL